MTRGIIIVIIIFSTLSLGCTKDKLKFVRLEPGSLDTIELANIGSDERPGQITSAGGHGGEAVDNGMPVFIIQFSKNGNAVAYVSRKDGKLFLIHNKTHYGPYEVLGDFAISPDGRSVAFVVKRGKAWSLSINGKEYGSYDEFGEPVFSPDSSHVAIEARKGNRWVVLVDGRHESRSCENYYEKPAFSADSKRLLLIENTKDVWIKNLLIADPEFRDVRLHQFRGRLVVMADDRARFAFVDERSDGKRLMQISFSDPDHIDVGPPYDELSYISFGRQGAHTAYAAIKQDRRYLVFDRKEEELPQGDLVSLPVIRPDGKGLVIFISDKDGVRPHEAFYKTNIDRHKYQQATDFLFSPDGRHYAYFGVKNNRLYLILDGREIETDYEVMITPVFSPDSRFLAFRAKKKGKRFVVTIDTKDMRLAEHPVFERIFEPVFSEDSSSVSYGVKDGNSLAWKTYRLR